MVSVFLGVPSSLGLALFGNLSLLALLFLGLVEMVTWESLVVVGNVDSTVNGSLHGSEDSVTGGGSDETNIQVSSEWSSVLDLVLFVNVKEVTINVLNTLVHISKTQFGKESSGNQETGGISSGVVGKTSINTEFLQFE